MTTPPGHSPLSPLASGWPRDAGAKRPRQTAALVAACVAWALAAATALAQEQRTVQQIEIVGLKTVSQKLAISAIRMRRGLPYTSKTSDDDIRRLYALGKFDDIEVQTLPVPNGIKVIYKVTESPVVKKINFKGNDAIKTKKLAKDMNLRVGSALKPFMLKLDEDHIAEEYKKKGYANVEVRSEVTKDGQVVTFYIQENPRVHIERIVFKGNRSIKAKKLLKQMQSRRRHFPAIFFKGHYEREKVKSDVFAVQEYYRDQGWLDAVVAHEIRYDVKKERITLVMFVEEGERYIVEQIRIRGNTLFATREIRSRLQLRVGGPFLAQALRDDVATIRKMYGEQGYIESKLTREVIHSQQAPKVSIHFDIDEGVRYYVEKIKIAGMDRLQDHVIRRELTLYPGDRFDTARVDDSVRRLKNTGFFDMGSPDAVAVDYEPGSRTDTKDLLLSVKEGKVGDISFGVGASSNYGLFGDIMLQHRNFDLFDTPKDARDLFTGNAFVGAGHILTLRLRPGLSRQDYLLSFQNPSVYDSPYGFGTSAFYRQRGQDTYDETRIGGTISGAKRITRDLTGRLTLKYENIDISNLDRSAPKDVLDVKGRHNRLGLELSFDYDKRDSRFLPSRGYILTTSIEITTLDVKVLRCYLGGSKYYTVANPRGWGKHILTVRGSAGAVGAYGAGVPIFERYFVGGVGSLRGFDFRGVGPVDSVTKDQIGGKYLLLGGVEYSVPVYKNTVRAHTFLDAGTTENSIQDFTDMRLAYGAGLELRLPIFRWMPITIDFGFPLIKKGYDDTAVFTFSIGSGFAF